MNAADTRGRTPLHQAFLYENPDLARLLLDHGADVNAASADGSTPLHYAVREFKGPDVFELLIDKEADLNAENDDGRTPLYEAVLYRQPQAVEILLEHGAEVNPLDNEGRSPFDYVREVQDAAYREMAQILREHGGTAVRNRATVSVRGRGRITVPVLWDFSEEMTLTKALELTRAEIDVRDATRIRVRRQGGDEYRDVSVSAFVQNEADDIELSNGASILIYYDE